MRAALAMLLAGCAYYEDRLPVAQPEQITASVSYTIHGDTACAPYVRADAEQSCREWGSVSRGHISYRLAWDLDARTLLQYSDAPLLVCYPRMSDPATGVELCGATTGNVVYLSTAPLCNTHATALHELGHLAGLRDVPEHPAVMHVWRDAHRIGAADVRECARVGLCPRPGPKDVTTVTVTVDPSIPNVWPEYPE